MMMRIIIDFMYKNEINIDLIIMTTYEKNLSEPCLSLVKFNIKTIEGRLDKGEFKNMNINDFILFTNNELGFERKILIKIRDISYYENFKYYLEKEKLEKCLSGIYNIENVLSIYYKYYKKNDEIRIQNKSI
jgi:ASC-1-like (ASCH) protein